MGERDCNACGDCLDRILTHRFLAYPILAAVLYVALSAALWAAKAVWQGTGLASAALLVCLSVLALLLAALEVCGYLARASFMTDRVFRRLGLDGGALPSLVLGIGCVLLVRMVFAGGRLSEGGLAYRLLGGESWAAALCAVYVPGLAAALWCVFLRRCVSLRQPVFPQKSVCFRRCMCLRRRGDLRRKPVRKDRDCHLILVMPEYRAPDGRSILRCGGRLLMRFAAESGVWLLVFYGAVWMIYF